MLIWHFLPLHCPIRGKLLFPEVSNPGASNPITTTSYFYSIPQNSLVVVFPLVVVDYYLSLSINSLCLSRHCMLIPALGFITTTFIFPPLQYPFYSFPIISQRSHCTQHFAAAGVTSAPQITPTPSTSLPQPPRLLPWAPSRSSSPCDRHPDVASFTMPERNHPLISTTLSSEPPSHMSGWDFSMLAIPPISRTSLSFFLRLRHGVYGAAVIQPVNPFHCYTSDPLIHLSVGTAVT